MCDCMFTYVGMCVCFHVCARVLREYPHMCTCLSVYLCAHVWLCMFTCMDMCACLHVCTCVCCASARVRVCFCVHVCECGHACLHVRACVHACASARVIIHVYVCCVCCVLFHVCEHAHMHTCAPATHFATHSHSTALGSSQRRHSELTRAGPWAGNGARGSSRPAPRTAVARRMRWRSARESDPGVRRGGLGAAGSSAHTSARHGASPCIRGGVIWRCAQLCISEPLTLD